MAGRIVAGTLSALFCLLAGAAGVLIGSFSNAGGSARQTAEALIIASMVLPLPAIGLSLWLVRSGRWPLALLMGPAVFGLLVLAYSLFLD